ncbi:hypothetical protein D3C71_1131720 [compost metagenome]
MFQRAHLFKYGGVACQRRWGVEAARTTTAGFFTMTSVRRRVGPEEDTGKTAGNQLTQRLLVDITLEDWQAVKVRAHAADQHVIAVEHQMLWGNGCGQQFVTVAHVLCRIFGRDVFKDHFQPLQTLAQRLHDGLNEASFTIKNVNVRMRDFAVDQ